MPEFTAEFPVEVYWEDTDAGGIVYHSNYLKFMERARSNLLKELKVAQANSLTDPDGVLFVAVSVAIRYRRAAKLEDHLTVRTRIKTLRRASIVFEQNVYRGSELITEGEVRVGAVSRPHDGAGCNAGVALRKNPRAARPCRLNSSSFIPTKLSIMNTTADLSILTLIANASLVVKAVLAILIVLSLASWTVIFQKFFVVRRAMRQTDDFESRFWSGTELTKLLDTANRSRDTSGMEERIFAAGMNEFMKQRQTAGAADTVNSVSRAMRAVFTREMDRLENGLPMLASIGSTSPYIGLFGTVWGIMNAFTGLSSLENASLAVVAPGIAEALVATAIGLFAAIPAVAAYNYYNNRVGRLSNRVDGFSEEFLNILERQSR